MNLLLALSTSWELFICCLSLFALKGIFSLLTKKYQHAYSKQEIRTFHLQVLELILSFYCLIKMFLSPTHHGLRNIHSVLLAESWMKSFQNPTSFYDKIGFGYLLIAHLTSEYTYPCLMSFLVYISLFECLPKIAFLLEKLTKKNLYGKHLHRCSLAVMATTLFFYGNLQIFNRIESWTMVPFLLYLPKYVVNEWDFVHFKNI